MGKFWSTSLVFLLFALFVSAKGMPADTTDWRAHALSLTGSAEIHRKRAIQEIRSIPQVSDLLKAALKGEDRFLALDCISALELEELIPEILKEAKTDESGFFYISLNSFLDRKKELLTVYQQRLGDPQTPNASRVVLLDTFGRMLIPIPKNDVKIFLEPGQSPEVRSAALNYIRHFLKRSLQPDYLSLLELGLVAKPFQLRVQTRFMLMELSIKQRGEVRGMRESCEKETNPDAKAVCEIDQKKFKG